MLIALFEANASGGSSLWPRFVRGIVMPGTRLNTLFDEVDSFEDDLVA